MKWADGADPASFEAAITPKTKAIMIESIANPGGVVIDIAAVSKIAKAHGMPLIVDNTQATPYLCRPIEHGADVVLHSLTKFMGGHGNSIGGVIVDCGTFDWMGHEAEIPDAGRAERQLQRHEARRDVRQLRLRHRLPRHGAARPGPRHLAVQRVHDPHRHRDAAAAHGASLRQRARRRPASRKASEGRLGELRGPRIEQVHAMQKRIAPKGAGAVFTFGLKGGYDAGVKFVSGCELLSHLANIGDTRSLVIHPASTTHRQLTDEQRTAAGAGGDVVRLSIGLEDAADIIADIDRALAGV